MAFQDQPTKRPRLSLQIKTASSHSSANSRTYMVNPRDPTSFNTLSNVYATAIERSTPLYSEPLTAINTLQAFSIATPADYKLSQQHVVTPYVASYPETPLTANSPPPKMQINYPSTMTATPPLSAGTYSAGPRDSQGSKVFTFSAADTAASPLNQNLLSPITAPSPRWRRAPPRHARLEALPYSPSRAVNSILRNSPLPPATAIPPVSSRRQSLRLVERAAKRVEYNSPLTQDITTNLYTKSHIDLLYEEASPQSPLIMEPTEPLDLVMEFTANEIQDGGRTPGPFGEMRRRMASTGSETPISPAGPAGIRKRKKKSKPRRWVWTIGQDDDGEEVAEPSTAVTARAGKEKAIEDDTMTPMATLPRIVCEETPTPSIESADSCAESYDTEMSDISSQHTDDDRGITPGPDGDLDLKTPIVSRRPDSDPMRQRDTPIPELGEQQRDTPVPPEMLLQQRDTPVPPEYIC